MPTMSPAAISDRNAQLAEIAKATKFSATIRLGPHDKRTRWFEDADPRVAYAEALAAKAEFDAESRFGRRALVYAINSLGSFPLDDDLARDAGLID